MGIKKLLRKRVMEWHQFYVDYKELQASKDDFSFKTRLLDEVTKVNEFYFELERQAVEGKKNLFGEGSRRQNSGDRLVDGYGGERTVCGEESGENVGGRVDGSDGMMDGYESDREETRGSVNDNVSIDRVSDRDGRVSGRDGRIDDRDSMGDGGRDGIGGRDGRDSIGGRVSDRDSRVSGRDSRVSGRDGIGGRDGRDSIGGRDGRIDDRDGRIDDSVKSDSKDGKIINGKDGKINITNSRIINDKNKKELKGKDKKRKNKIYKESAKKRTEREEAKSKGLVVKKNDLLIKERREKSIAGEIQKTNSLKNGSTDKGLYDKAEPSSRVPRSGSVPLGSIARSTQLTQLPIPRPRSTQLPRSTKLTQLQRATQQKQERQRQRQQEQRQEQEHRNKSALLRVKPFVPKTKQKTRRIAAVRRQSAYNEVNYDYITEDQEFETSHELEENDALPRSHTFLNLGLIKLHYTVHKKKRATMEFIKVLNQIINYQRINYALLENCIARRRTSRRVKRNELQPLIKQSYFYRSKEAAVLLKDVKRLYRQRFVKNDKNAGRLFRRLRRRDRPKAVCVFASGVLITVNAFFMFSGVACREGVCALLPFLRGAQCSAAYDPYTPQLFFSLLFVGFYLFGVSLLIFTWKKINHPFIFSFNLDSHMEVSRYFVCTAALHLLYNVINALPIDAKASFALAMCAVGACIVLPLDVLYRKSRYYVVYCVLKIVCTPVFKVRFRHFFFTDYLQSFAIVYRKVLGCFFTLGPVSVFFICNYGNLVRVMQCGRRYYDKPERVHIYNAGKYVCQIMFSILTITYVHVQDGRTAHKNARILFFLKYLRLVVGILASSFSFVWDVRVDWGLGRKNLLFAKSTLAVLIVFNLVGRYLWLLSAYLSDFFVCVYEIVRRTNWGIVRVEYEHLNNCDQLKTTSTIKLSGDLFYRKNKRAEDMSGHESTHESTHDEKEESMV